MNEKYVAYVGSYSYNGNAKGITIYDVNVEDGSFTYRCEEEVNNSSYLAVSHGNQTLYSIADEGVVAYRIMGNGALSKLNAINIRGMRGCHLSVDNDNEYLFVSGYHDGKETVVSLNKDGSLKEVTDGVFHKGLGTVAERTFRPHVSCGRRSPDGNFLLVADLGIDQVKIYRIDPGKGKIKEIDAIRCEQQSAPRHFIFSADGKFLYLMYEVKNVIDVFTYEYKNGMRAPKIEKIQTIPSTAAQKLSQLTAACTIRMSEDEKYLFCSNAGDNSVSIYRRDEDTGLLDLISCLPISGDYPKDIAIFPDGKRLASINHGSNDISFFNIDYEKGLLVMNHRSIPVNEPNCCVIVKLSR